MPKNVPQKERTTGKYSGEKCKNENRKLEGGGVVQPNVSDFEHSGNEIPEFGSRPTNP